MTPVDLEESIASILGRTPGPSLVARISKYREILIKWQKITRLVGSSDPGWIIENVVLDSLLFMKVLPMSVRSLLDLGAGAGVPGIPLAIAHPDLDVTLVESRQKRASFLAQVVRELPLANARVMRARLTEASIPAELRGSFDAVVMRCAGDISKVLPLALRLVKPGGAVVASGPPDPYALPIGQWLTIPGVRPGSVRRFAVVARARKR